MADEHINSEMTREDEEEESVETLMLRDDMPKIYVNSLACGLAQHDIVMLLKTNNVTVAVVNISHEMGRTIARALNNMLTTTETGEETSQGGQEE